MLNAGVKEVVVIIIVIIVVAVVVIVDLFDYFIPIFIINVIINEDHKEIQILQNIMIRNKNNYYIKRTIKNNNNNNNYRSNTVPHHSLLRGRIWTIFIKRNRYCY